MKPSAVIFDRDGVLTYFDVKRATSFFQPLLPISLIELAGRWQKWGDQIGFPATVEDEESFFSTFWQQLRQEYGLDDDQYKALAACNYRDFICAFPEVAEVLRQLRGQGIKIGVLSNFSLASLESSLAAVGILDWIDVACAATVIGYAKPQAEAYLHVARLLQAPPQACLFLDDEAPCVKGAQDVGMTAYLVDRQRHDDASARHIVHNLRATLDLLT